MRFRAKMTSKGQLTLPAKLRDMLNLKAGDDVVFVENDAGAIVLDVGARSFSSLRGIVRVPNPRIDEWVDEARKARGEAASPPLPKHREPGK